MQTEPRITVVLAINTNGTAKLDDGTFWRIASKDQCRMAGWVGKEVQLSLNPRPNMLYPHRLTHIETGECVEAAQSQERGF
jgi:hypothetical protein